MGFVLGGSTFPLSDGASLLMRLHLEGVDIEDRARDQAAAWEKHEGDFTCLFFDGHGCFANLLARNTMENARWIEKMREYIRGERKVKRTNIVQTVTILCRGGTRR